MDKMIQLSYTVPIMESGILDQDFIIQGVAINATITANNHKFLSEELRTSAQSLNGVPLLVDHRNEISAIKGRVLTGEFDETNQRINFRAKVVDNDVKKMIKDGLINSVSVGAAVSSIEEEGDVLIPRGITFKELSLVAVPADGQATFAKAMFEAYQLVKPKEAKTEVKEEVKVVEETEDKIVMEIPSDAFEKITESPVIISSKEESMKGGIEMSEEITKTEQTEVQKLTQMIESLTSKIAEMEKAKTEVKPEVKEEAKVEVKEEVEEKAVEKYSIVSGFGSLRGSSYTLVRN